MKKYKFLKTFPGARDGITVETFIRGEVYELDEAFGDQFVAQAAAEETDLAVGGHVTGEDATVMPRTLADGETLDEGELPAVAKVKKGDAVNPADLRETKVDAPAETKDGEAGIDPATQNIEELVAVARDTYGLDVDSTMSEAELRKLIDEAEAKAEESAEGLYTETISGKPGKPKKKR